MDNTEEPEMSDFTPDIIRCQDEQVAVGRGAPTRLRSGSPGRLVNGEEGSEGSIFAGWWTAVRGPPPPHTGIENPSRPDRPLTAMQAGASQNLLYLTADYSATKESGCL